ncbi:hypothetical protein Ddc_10417 [Ditylenchus destructor]|nr:hypothetical protein Ddc_10417 [Ditylenchus destructor]
MQKSDSKKDPIDKTKIFVRNLVHSDKDWFHKEFVDCFIDAYRTKQIYVRSGDANISERRLLKSLDEKRDWLLATAQEEFQDYVVNRKPGYEGLVITYEGQPIGAILIRLRDDDEKTIYLGQAMVSVSMQGRGFSYYFIDKILPDRYPDYKRYEAVIRYENGIPFHLFETKLPVIQDADLPRKYGYDPESYTDIIALLSSLSSIQYHRSMGCCYSKYFTQEHFSDDKKELDTNSNVNSADLNTFSDDTNKLDTNSNKNPVDLNKVSARNFKIDEDKDWFLRQFVDSFTNYYKNRKIYVITGDNSAYNGCNAPKRRLLESLDEKKNWLLDTAREEFQNYVVSPKPGYKGLVIMYDGVAVGAVLIRLRDDDEKTIYLGQVIVSVSLQRQRIASHFICNILPELYPEYTCYEALTRYENGIPFHLFNTELPVVEVKSLPDKYGYDMHSYTGFVYRTR